MGRQPCCYKVGLKRGPWSFEEDQKLTSFILQNGILCWRVVPKLAGLLRCGKSCRLRWINYLRPDLKRGDFTELEENQIIQLHSRLGNRWSKIASHFPGRTDNEIKNHWNTRIKKRLKQLGLDPVNHKPIEQAEVCIESVQEANSELKKEEECLGTKPLGDQAQKGHEKMDKNKEQVDPLLKLEDISEDILMEYDIFCGSLELGSRSNHETNNPSTSYTTSLSIEESINNPTVGESPTFQEESIRQWVDSVDSFLTLDCLGHLDGDLFFLENDLSNLQHSGFKFPQ